MNLKAKRKDAAHTLVVPYDATPDMVNAAYERRLGQRFNLDISDMDSFTYGCELLYDAHIRMCMPENSQWLAQLRLMLTNSVDKTTSIAKIGLKQLRNNVKSEICQNVIDDVTSSINKAQRKYNLFRGICAYEIGGLWGTIIYNTVSAEHNSIVPLVVYGSMFIGAFALAGVRDLMHRDLKRLSAQMDFMHVVLPYDKLFSRTL